MSTRRARHAAVWLHRWTGLVIAGFLIVTALTGALVAFYDELETLLIPELVRVTIPRDGAGRELPMLDALLLRDRVAARYPGAAVDWVDLHREPGRTQLFGIAPARQGDVLAADEVFVDPYRGEIVGERLHGDLAQGRRNVMPFLMTLHESLAAGDTGRTVLGVAALLWTLDCFVGLSLTFPLRRRTDSALPARRSWWSRWAPAWRIRSGGVSAEKFVFDLHRATSLWLWGVLLLFAWSSVGFNLGQVYRPLMGLLGYVEAAPLKSRGIGDVQRLQEPVLGWQAALAVARQAMAAESQQHGFEVIRERLIAHRPERQTYEYRTLSTLDVGRKLGNTTLSIDDRSGELVGIELPTGRSIANTLDTWLSNLHTAAVGGVWVQGAVASIGLLLVVVSVSGIELFRRRVVARRRARNAAARAPVACA